MIYLDFYQYTPPGTDLVYLGLFKAFGVHAWIASAVVVLLGMAALFVCYAIAAQVMPRTTRTACPERNRPCHQGPPKSRALAPEGSLFPSASQKIFETTSTDCLATRG